MPKDLAKRIGREERDAVIELLREHYTAERLTYEEFQERMGKASEAKIGSQLAALLSDLPKIDQPPKKKVAEKKKSRPIAELIPGSFWYWIFIAVIWLLIIGSFARHH